MCGRGGRGGGAPPGWSRTIRAVPLGPGLAAACRVYSKAWALFEASGPSIKQ